MNLMIKREKKNERLWVQSFLLIKLLFYPVRFAPDKKINQTRTCFPRHCEAE